MSQEFGEAYANVVDFGAKGDGATDDTAAIQAAIDTKRHVLFPAGTFAFSSSLDASGATIPLTFGNDEQRCVFLAGAVLVPATSAAYVLISGQRQVFVGLRIEADESVAVHSPVLEIYGAFDLWLQELRVSVRSITPSSTGVSAAVRVMYLTKCDFVAGEISGGKAEGTVGLWLASSYDYDFEGNPNPTPGSWGTYLDDTASTADQKRELARASSGAYEVGAVGLQIASFGWGVRVGCITDNPSFVNCGFVDNGEGAVVVMDDAAVVAASGASDAVGTPTVAVGLNLVGCHFSGGSPAQYVQVDAGCSWQGGVVMGCTFDAGAIDPGLPGAGTLRSPTSKAVGARRSGPPGSSGAPPSRALRSAWRGVAAAAESAAGKATGRWSGSLGGVGASGTPVGGLAQPADGPVVIADDAARSANSTTHNIPAWCVLRIEGGTQGVVATGCSSVLSGFRSSVWIIDGQLTQTCDLFNAWAQATTASGAHASHLVRLAADEQGVLALAASSVRFDTAAMGFFGAEPVSQETYFSLGIGSRVLGPSNADRVVAQLLTDLAALGLVKKRAL